ncbi:hypothetical protein BV25DRAFT_1817721 [Artomyces pyxidatus]|uniref:Uncharacterized protein n=1 Tax=Artomyces pyxidatus TaxID=48021 RepID=A0ACB8TK68_9AGAM|nr:hypothetical protein BV25DRAFT_1817721 [Artomyces pyxidatus]
MSQPWPTSGPSYPPPNPLYKPPIQHRATAPAPGQNHYAQPPPPFPTPAPPSIPHSLIPGYPSRAQTFGASLDSLLFNTPETRYRHASNASQYYPPVSPQAPPGYSHPLHRPEFHPQAVPPPVPPLPPVLQRPEAPPLPPKAPLMRDGGPPLPPKPSSTMPTSSPSPPKRPSLSPASVSMPHLPRAFPAPMTLPSPAEVDEDAPDPEEEAQLALALRMSAKESLEHEYVLATQEEQDLARALEESKLDAIFVESPQSDYGFPTAVSPVSQSSVSSWSSLQQSPQSIPPALSRRTQSFQSLASSTYSQMQEDEALARRLAAEGEEDDGPTPTSSRFNSTDYAHESETLDARSRGGPRDPHSASAKPSPHMPRMSLHPSPVPPNERRPSLEIPIASPPYSDKNPSPQSHSSSSSTPLETPMSSSASSASGSLEEDKSNPPQRAASVSSGHSSASSQQSSSSRTTMTPNEFVETELLNGVSFGFQPPVISATREVMRAPVPNIISLPYGKFPPMHIQAPCWRQLLKLMAKLSATQIEPAIESLAVTKGELKLRTVVQFVKVHHSSTEWRTILYLSIDYPIPPEAQSSWKYHNDVNVLPYSYSLSNALALMRDGPDSPMAKYYTIPATSRTPLPSLPISMPSMAMYLASALEDSRRALNDTSSGVRKLAKLINQLYPEDSVSPMGEGDGGRTGTKALLGRLMGRKTNRGRNADVYELVTPFVADEWGA